MAETVGGVRNLDKSRPHTDVETSDTVYEVKSTQASVPQWLSGATEQCRLASEESNKNMGGVIKVWTKGSKSRAFLITEIELLLRRRLNSLLLFTSKKMGNTNGGATHF